MGKIIFFLCIFSSLSLYSIERHNFFIFDYSQLKVSCHANSNKDFWEFGQLGFNSAPEIGSFLVFLKAEYGIQIAIETGTYTGNTTVFLSFLFDRVHTIEYDENTYHTTRETLHRYPNIISHLGSSEVVLSKILPSLEGERLLLYLDAHWYNFWPLRDEILVASLTHIDNCILVIDDFKVPHRNEIPYDKYGVHECSYEYIKEQLDVLYSDYITYYLIPKNPHQRAKFVVIPKEWKN